MILTFWFFQYPWKFFRDFNILHESVHMTGLFFQKLIKHVRIILALLAVQVNPHPLHGVEDQGHGVDGVGVHNRFEHDPLLEAIVCLVNYPHLFQKCGFTSLGCTKEQQINFILNVVKDFTKSFCQSLLMLSTSMLFFYSLVEVPASCFNSWSISLSICREIFFFSSTFAHTAGVSQERIIPMTQYNSDHYFSDSFYNEMDDTDYLSESSGSGRDGVAGYLDTSLHTS